MLFLSKQYKLNPKDWSENAGGGYSWNKAPFGISDAIFKKLETYNFRTGFNNSWGENIMKKSRVREIIREEIENMNEEQQLNEALSSKDYSEIKDIIRAEVAAIFFDLFKKKQIWI